MDFLFSSPRRFWDKTDVVLNLLC